MSKKLKKAKKHRRLKRIAKLFSGGSSRDRLGSELLTFITTRIMSQKEHITELQQQRLAFQEDLKQRPAFQADYISAKGG